MDQIGHFNPAIDLPEMMLVMPEIIRTEPLLIHKIRFVFHVGDLRHPEHRYAKQGLHFIGHHLARIHFLTEKVVGELQVQVIRRHHRQVLGMREKIPGFVNTYRDILDFL